LLPCLLFFMNFYLTAVLLGLGFASLALGIFLTMRIFNIPDITTDGSFTLGGAVTAVMMTSDTNMWGIFPVVFLCGALAGSVTGLIHTKLKVNALLAGILVMTALYSVNLSIMGRSNVPLMNATGLLQQTLSSQIVILLVFALLLWLVLTWLLKTDFGLTIRATGNNESMIRALGVNTDKIKIIGIALANGLIALSGFLVTQVQGYADINMGVGIVILGLGSVMIGEIVAKGFRNAGISLHLLAAIVGCIIFRLILAFALSLGIDAMYLKLVVSALVLLAISIPNIPMGKAIRRTV
jgi:putative tryptophan/tyrosine transport system permease protein